MGYKPFKHGEQLNPDKLNEKFDQVFKLLSKAYITNSQLQSRLSMVNAAYETSVNLVTTQDDGLGNDEIVYDINSAYKFYDMVVANGGREMHIAGPELISNSLGNLTNVVTDKLVSDNHSIVLATKEGEEVLSRIPLTQTDLGDYLPSLGVQITSDQFDNNMLGHIVSPTSVWGEKVNSSVLVSDLDLGQKAEIDFSLPSTLSPYLNTFKVSPVPGVKYRLFYMVGDAEKEATSGWTYGTKNLYLQKDVFNGTFRLDLYANPLSVDTGNVAFAVSRVEALYNPFADEGYTEGQYTFSSIANATITAIDTGVDMTNIKLTILNIEDDVVYDSTLNGFPYPIAGSSDTFDLIGNVMKYKFEFTKNLGTTPEVPYLNIKYKETP